MYLKHYVHIKCIEFVDVQTRNVNVAPNLQRESGVGVARSCHLLQLPTTNLQLHHVTLLGFARILNYLYWNGGKSRKERDC